MDRAQPPSFDARLLFTRCANSQRITHCTYQLSRNGCIHRITFTLKIKRRSSQLFDKIPLSLNLDTSTTSSLIPCLPSAPASTRVLAHPSSQHAVIQLYTNSTQTFRSKCVNSLAAPRTRRNPYCAACSVSRLVWPARSKSVASLSPLPITARPARPVIIPANHTRRAPPA